VHWSCPSVERIGKNVGQFVVVNSVVMPQRERERAWWHKRQEKFWKHLLEGEI